MQRRDVMTSSDDPVASSPVTKARAVVLAAVDSSLSSSKVVQQASRQALSMNAALHLVQVVELVPAMVLEAPPLVVPGCAHLLQRSWQELDRLLSLVDESVVDVRAHVAVGSPVTKILQLATDLEADLLVIGAHDASKFEQVIFGSVAAELTRKAPCPVLVVRPKRHHHPAVPEILPPCPDCLATRAASEGQRMWCERHDRHHPRMHTYREVPDPFAVGSLTFQP